MFDLSCAGVKLSSKFSPPTFSIPILLKLSPITCLAINVSLISWYIVPSASIIKCVDTFKFPAFIISGLSFGSVELKKRLNDFSKLLIPV